MILCHPKTVTRFIEQINYCKGLPYNFQKRYCSPIFYPQIYIKISDTAVRYWYLNFTYPYREQSLKLNDCLKNDGGKSGILILGLRNAYHLHHFLSKISLCLATPCRDNLPFRRRSVSYGGTSKRGGFLEELI